LNKLVFKKPKVFKRPAENNFSEKYFSPEKGKPGENRRRKAMGLSRIFSATIARLPDVMWFKSYLRAWRTGSFYLNEVNRKN